MHLNAYTLGTCTTNRRLAYLVALPLRSTQAVPEY